MSLPHAVLGVLEARPMSGYELVQFFDSSMEWVWSAPQSQIYPRLHKMQAEGMIEGTKEVKGRRLERTVYSITPRGLEELRAWVVRDERQTRQRDPTFLRASFFDLVEPEQAVAVLEKEIAEQEALVAQWSEHRDRLLAMETPLIRERLRHRPPAQHELVAQLKAHVFDGKIAAAAARIEWARRGIALLHEGAAVRG
jgi:DNA-binding PadR family transcriptional regulator